jgi:hypothetical protein
MAMQENIVIGTPLVSSKTLTQSVCMRASSGLPQVLTLKHHHHFNSRYYVDTLTDVSLHRAVICEVLENA